MKWSMSCIRYPLAHCVFGQVTLFHLVQVRSCIVVTTALVSNHEMQMVFQIKRLGTVGSHSSPREWSGSDGDSIWGAVDFKQIEQIRQTLHVCWHTRSPDHWCYLRHHIWIPWWPQWWCLHLCDSGDHNVITVQGNVMMFWELPSQRQSQCFIL